MMLYMMFLIMLALIILRLPIAIAIGTSCLVYVLGTGGIPLHTAVQRMASGINNYTLLAVPFFILAGNLMNHGGISTRIFNFANACVGSLKGGLAHVNVLASVIFAGMSGAAVADAGGLGAIEIKAMKDHGYGDKITIGITAASSLIGPIIPPSMPFVVYGVAASVSIGRLFAAGVVPGMLMAVSLMLLVYLRADAFGCPQEPATSLKNIACAFINAFFSLMAPVIVLGGIFTGWFTATESAAIASLYALVLGFAYQDLNWLTVKRALVSSMTTTIQVLFIVASASLFAYILAREQVPQRLAAWVLELTSNYWLILLILNVLLVIVGLFMESLAAINILVPVFLPLFQELQINPVHFGLIMCVNLMIGTLTPPFGAVLFVLSGVSGIAVEKVFKHTAVFLIPLLIVLALINIFPGLSLFLPNLLFGPE